MATVTGFTAERMLVIENTTVVDGEVQGDNLILMTREGTPIDAGNVRGPKGDTGATGAPGAGNVESVNDQQGAVYSPRIFDNKAALDLWATGQNGSLAVTKDTETVWQGNEDVWFVNNVLRGYDTAAARDTRWPNAPRGSQAVNVDNDSVAYKSAAGWNQSNGVRAYANPTERNARWPSPPQGALCITLDTYSPWMYTSSGWLPASRNVQGQPGTAVRFGSVAIPNLNQIGNFVFDVIGLEGGVTFPYRVLIEAQYQLYAGYGSAEGMGQTDIVPYAVGAAVATGASIRIPAAAWMPFPLGAAWYVNANTDCGFKIRWHNHSTTNFHTGGQVTWSMISA